MSLKRDDPDADAEPVTTAAPEELDVPQRQGRDGVLSALADLVATVTSVHALDVLPQAAEGVQGLTSADVVVLTTADGGGNQVVRAVAGRPGGPPSPGDVMPLAGTLAGEALRTGQVQRCQDAEHDPRTPRSVDRRHGIRSSVMVPLLVAGVPHGLVCLLSATSDAFTDADVDVARVVAGAVAGRLSQVVSTAEQETLLRTVFDALDEGIVVRSWPDATVLLVNDAAERILDVAAGELSGRELRKGWQWFDEHGRTVAVPDLPTSYCRRTGEPVRNRLLEVVDAGGDRRWLELTALPVRDRAGQLTSVVTRVADVSERLRDRRALERSERRLAHATEVTGLAWWDYDVREDRHSWSDGMFALLGVEPGEPPGLAGLLERVHPDDRALLEPGDSQAGTRVFRVVHPDGAVRFLQSWSDVVRDADGEIVLIRGTTLDVTDRERFARAVADSEEMFRVAFDEAPTGMAIVSLEPGRVGRVLSANEALARTLGADPGALTGTTAEDWLHPDEVQRAQADLLALASGDEVAARDMRLRHAEGPLVHAWVRSAVLSSGLHGGRCVLLHVLDVTEQRRAEASLEQMAMTDALTGLANRARLTERMAAALARLAEGPDGVDGSAVAALLLDLDRFKLVNDVLGHPVGDDLLVEVAARLSQVAPEGTCVARLGGDEFVVLLEGRDAGRAHEVASLVVDALREPYELPSGHRVVTTASVGISLATRRGRSVSDLLREADLALYRAKDAGRDRVAVCDDELRAGAVARVDVENLLRTALDAGGLELHLQPVVDLATGHTVGAEALVRVRSGRGLLPPATFIEVAEETGLVAKVDGWVVERAVGLLAERGGPVERIAVNVSGRTLQEPGFAEQVLAVLDAHGVAGSRLDVEITESVLLEATSGAREALAALRAAGVRVGLDDFGTGYSALAYLQRLPLDFLKIDRSFVVRLARQDAAAEATVRAIVDVAHAHRLVVTAEGVETPEQARVLRDLGCDRGQGWLFGRPAPPARP